MRFETVNIPLIEKAWAGTGGRMRIGGIASDESVDLDDEVTAANGLADSLDYLRRWGKFNDNHSDTLLGEVDEAEITTKGALVRKGIFTESEIPPERWAEKCLWVAGYLYPRIRKAKEYYDIMRSGGRIGLSLQGRILRRAVLNKAGKRVLVNSKCFVNQIAITGEPKNMNAVAKILKSLNPPGPCSGCTTCKTGGGECLREAMNAAMRTEAARQQEVLALRKGLGGTSSEMSLDELRFLVQNAVSQSLPPESPIYVEDLYDDYAIVNCRGKLFRVPYTVEDRQVELGDWTEVTAKKIYEPVEKSMTTGAGIVSAGEGGGECLRVQSIEGRPKKAGKGGPLWDEDEATGETGGHRRKRKSRATKGVTPLPLRPSSTAGRLAMLKSIEAGEVEAGAMDVERLVLSLRDERFGWEEDALGKSLVDPHGLDEEDISLLERIHGMSDEEVADLSRSLVKGKAGGPGPLQIPGIKHVGTVDWGFGVSHIYHAKDPAAAQAKIAAKIGGKAYSADSGFQTDKGMWHRHHAVMSADERQDHHVFGRAGDAKYVYSGWLRDARKSLEKGSSMEPGGGGRFRKLRDELARRGVEDPDALAAWIGRKKYGKKRFQQMAAKSVKGLIHEASEEDRCGGWIHHYSHARPEQAALSLVKQLQGKGHKAHVSNMTPQMAVVRATDYHPVKNPGGCSHTHVILRRRAG